VVRGRNHHKPPRHLNRESGPWGGGIGAVMSNICAAGTEAPGRIFSTTTRTSSPRTSWTRTLFLRRAHTSILALLKSGAWRKFFSLSLAYCHAGLGRLLASLNWVWISLATCESQVLPARRPPHRRLWGPLGKGGALCHRRSTAVPVGPPRPSSITHPEAAPATVNCSYIVRLAPDVFLTGAIWYTTRWRRCQAPALRRARHSKREEGALPQAFRRGEHMGRVCVMGRLVH